MSELVERLLEFGKYAYAMDGDNRRDVAMLQAAARIAELEARVKLLEDVADAADNVVQNLPMFPLHASVRVLTRRLAALNPSARSE